MPRQLAGMLIVLVLSPDVGRSQPVVSQSLAPVKTAISPMVVDAPAIVPVSDSPVAAEPESRWYVSAEYLVWWLREGHVPPLLTISSPTSQGLLGRSDTRILYG